MTVLRRAALLCGAVLLLVGCSGAGDPAEQAPTGDPRASVEPRRPPSEPRLRSSEQLPSPPPPPEAAPPATPPVGEQAAGALAAIDDVESVAQLADILTFAETAIRDERVGGDALANAGHLQQRAYRRLGTTPKWRNRVLRHIPRGLRPAVRANMEASASLGSLATPQDKLPDWRIVSPPPAPRLLRHYRRAADMFGLEWEYLAAINLVETRMGRIRGTSTAGAQGPMQFMPATWAAYGRGDVNKPRDAIEGAARYLAASGAPGDMRKALWHYNHSDYYVDAVSAYADVMRADPRAFRGYYHWQVYYVTVDGDVHLPEGYGS